ncbi:MAG: acyltransferase [Mucilaginibacter sp.]|uniref:acyltransferase family protein n=1 Tax=Mucilaginibacter sp. TaxID=1882438 RepID=UPI0031AB6031
MIIRKLAYIDALRGLAILAVMLVHCGYAGSPLFIPATVSNIVRQGAFGVQLFFVASAFTLFLSFEARSITDKHRALYFFIRRFFRIAPMYYIAMLYYHFQNSSNVHTQDVVANLFFVHGLNPNWIATMVPGGWTTSVEMIFYCFVPLLYAKIKSLKQAYNFALICLVIRIIANTLLRHYPLVNDSNVWNEFLYYYFINQLPIFALGIVLFFLVKERGHIDNYPRIIATATALMFVQLCASPNTVFPAEFLFGVAFVILALFLSRFNVLLLLNPVVTNIGKVSYSMYLTHFAVLYWFEKLNIISLLNVTGAFTAIVNLIVRFVMVALVSFMVSSLFYRIIELPLQAVGKRLITFLNR